MWADKACFSTCVPQMQYFWKRVSDKIVLYGKGLTEIPEKKARTTPIGKFELVYLTPDVFDKEAEVARIFPDQPLKLNAGNWGSTLDRSVLLLKLVSWIVANQDTDMIGFTMDSVFLLTNGDVAYVDYQLNENRIREIVSLSSIDGRYFAPEFSKAGPTSPKKTLVYAIGRLMLDLMEKGFRLGSRCGLLEVLARVCLSEKPQERPELSFILLCLQTGLFVVQDQMIGRFTNVAEFKKEVAKLKTIPGIMEVIARTAGVTETVEAWKKSEGQDARCMLGFMYQYGFLVKPSPIFAKYYEQSDLDIARAALKASTITTGKDFVDEHQKQFIADMGDPHKGNSSYARMIRVDMEKPENACELYLDIMKNGPSDLVVPAAVRISYLCGKHGKPVPEIVLDVLKKSKSKEAQCNLAYFQSRGLGVLCEPHLAANTFRRLQGSSDEASIAARINLSVLSKNGLSLCYAPQNDEARAHLAWMIYSADSPVSFLQMSDFQRCTVRSPAVERIKARIDNYLRSWSTSKGFLMDVFKFLEKSGPWYTMALRQIVPVAKERWANVYGLLVRLSSSGSHNQEDVSKLTDAVRAACGPVRISKECKNPVLLAAKNILENRKWSTRSNIQQLQSALEHITVDDLQQFLVKVEGARANDPISELRISGCPDVIVTALAANDFTTVDGQLWNLTGPSELLNRWEQLIQSYKNLFVYLLIKERYVLSSAYGELKQIIRKDNLDVKVIQEATEELQFLEGLRLEQISQLLEQNTTVESGWYRQGYIRERLKTSNCEESYKMAADKGHPRACYKLGLIYLAKNMNSEARRYLEKASAAGDMDARFKLLDLDKSVRHSPSTPDFL